MLVIPRVSWEGATRCLAAIAILTLDTPAQTSRPDPSSPSLAQANSGEQLPEWQPDGVLRVPRYVAAFSWPLFAACDSDADDRIDLIEAQSCIIMLELDDARLAFRRLDKNADGFLYWPEFDQIFREAVSEGDGLYLHPSRVALLATLPGLEPKDGDRPQAVEVLATFDRNRDRALSPEELAILLNSYGLDPKLAKGLAVLDINGSGAIELAELETILQFVKLPSIRRIQLQPEAEESPRFAIDQNDDDQIELSELQRALMILAPTLTPWAATILKQADQDRNQLLSLKEILEAR